MPWVTIDCQLPAHPKMAALPSDAARYGWIVVITEAKLQRKPGTFASAAHFQYVMGRYGRFLKDYQAVGLIDVGTDGTVAVHDWERHQWRAAKERQREDNGGTNQGQEEDSRAGSVVPVPVSVTTSPGEEGSGETGGPDALVAYHSLTGRFPTGNVKTWLDELADIHGHTAVIEALAAENIADATLKTLISRTESRLALEAHEAEKQRQERARMAAEAERKKIEAMPPEQRSANLGRLAQMMADAGIGTPKPKAAS